MKHFSRLAMAILALALTPSLASAQSRSLTVDDIVAFESFGRASISPAGDRAVYERRGAYETTPSFVYGQRSVWAIWDLHVLDLKRPSAAPERLLPSEPVGLLRGLWSPSGKHLIVYRFGAGRYEVGIADVDARTAHWTGLTAELPLTGIQAEWISDDQVALMVRPDGSLPRLMRLFGEGQARRGEAWRRTAEGHEASRTVLETRDGIVTTERPSPEQAIVILDLSTHAQRTVARGVLPDFALSPDKTVVAILEGGAAISSTREPFEISPVPHRQRLRLVRLADGATTVTEEAVDVAPHLLRWSADSTTLLVWSRRDGQPWAEGAVTAVARDGRLRRFRHDALSPATRGIDILGGVRADWMGDRPLLYASRPDATRWDWFELSEDQPPRALTEHLASAPTGLSAVEDDAVQFFADGRLWLADAQGVRSLTDEGLALSMTALSDDQRIPRQIMNNTPRRQWSAASTPDGGGLVASREGERAFSVQSPEDLVRTLDVSERAALVVTHDEVVETLRLRMPDGEFEIDQTNEGMASVVMERSVAVPHADALGRPGQSQLFLPRAVPLNQVKGLIVLIYPGSVTTDRWFGTFGLTYGIRAQVLAAAGYAVLSPLVPVDLPETAAPDFYVRSVDLAVDAALASYPDLPANRIAVFGHSFGGYAALAIAARSSRYQSYIASSALTDFVGSWGEFGPNERILTEDGHAMNFTQGWAELGQGGTGGPPWDKLNKYIELSPYFVANRITAPVMLMSADIDYVPLSQSERIFSTLYRTGGRSRIVTYWGEHHSRWSPANIRDGYTQIFDWLDETLPPRAEPEPVRLGSAP